MPQSRLPLLAPPLLLLGGWLIFYALKEPPGDGDVEAYRNGLGAYATFSAIVIGLLIARASRRRGLAVGALVVCLWATLAYHVDNAAFEVHAAAAFGIGVAGGELVWLASALTTLSSRSGLLTYLWTSLLIVLPAATGWVASEGTWLSD